MLVDDIRSFRGKLKQGFVLGPFSKTSDPALIEIMGYAGFDFVIIDLEHGPVSVETSQNLIRAAQIGGLLPIVRVKEGNLSVIKEVLDIGAGGVQVPQVRSQDDAKNAVQAARFAPQGMRGVCRFVRAARYSAEEQFKYFKEANEAILIVQVEGKESIECLEEILSVEGIDVVFIGPYDLSQSLGLTGRVDHPEVVKKMREINETCLKKGVVVGTFVDTPEDARRWIDAGIRYISYSVDMGIFYNGCSDTVRRIKENRDQF
ncbi:MAG: HpcH/HpaI aldolase family protein [Spirochaetota bacterium]